MMNHIKTKMIRFKLLILVISFQLLLISNYAFSQNGEENSIFNSILKNDFVKIGINYSCESYYFNEINIIYSKNNLIYIHSIKKNNFNFQDTIFHLSSNQIMFLDEFEKKMKMKNLNINDTVFASSNCRVYVQSKLIDIELKIKNEFSFIDELIKSNKIDN
jgi:hypothetical protein